MANEENPQSEQPVEQSAPETQAPQQENISQVPKYRPSRRLSNGWRQAGDLLWPPMPARNPVTGGKIVFPKDPKAK